MCPSPDSGNAGVHRVLVVDDEPTLRLGFAYALTSRTVVVETAASGPLALERLTDSSYHIMFLDLRMPEMDGLGVIEKLRARGDEIPIVLCSAALSPNAALRAIRHRVVHFLLKPVRPVDLRQVMAAVLQPSGPLHEALQAARQGNHAEAVRILQPEAARCRHATGWSQVLKAMGEAAPGNDSTRLEDRIRSSLPLLASNSAP